MHLSISNSFIYYTSHSSWMLVSLALGVSYSTGFTSILTSPAYTKSVDTIEDFLEAGSVL